MTTTVLPAAYCCCDEEDPLPPFGGNCAAFPAYIAEHGPDFLGGNLKLEWSDGDSWVEIFSTSWGMLRMGLGYPPDTPPYAIDPLGFWRAGTGGALPFAGPSGQCWRAEDIDALDAAGYLKPGSGYFSPLIERVQLLALQCQGIPSFSASLVLVASMPVKCAKVYYTPESGNCWDIDPEDPCIPAILHSQACCNAGCCPEDPVDPPHCTIADIGYASYASGPSYTIQELLDGHWTLPVRSRTFTGGYESCTRTYRITTSVG